MRDLLPQPKPKKYKNKRGEEVPFKFEIPLLYDSTLEFPGEWSTQQLPNSGHCKKNKRPSAWAEFHEEEERLSRTVRWAPRQLGLGDMVISRTLKVHSAFSVSLQCLTSASFTGSRR